MMAPELVFDRKCVTNIPTTEFIVDHDVTLLTTTFPFCINYLCTCDFQNDKMELFVPFCYDNNLKL